MQRERQLGVMADGPSSSVAALASVRADGLSVRAVKDLDTRTAIALARAVEARRKKGMKLIASVFAVPYIPLGLSFVHPVFALIGLPLCLVAGGVCWVSLKALRAGFIEEAKDLGVDGKVAVALHPRFKKAAGEVPRWIKGEERIEAIAQRVVETVGSE